MEDPQFKAMMEANPKMKEQMEKAMKMMESNDLNALIPTGMTAKIKGKKSLTSVVGGMNEVTETLNTGDGKVYIIDRESKSYHEEKALTKDDDFDDSNTTVTKTSETRKILGYTCTKYVIKTKQNDRDLEQYIWATSDIDGLNFSDFAEMREHSKQKMVLAFKKIEGVPLRMEMGAQGVKMVIEAIEVKRGGVSNSDFEIPAGFKKVSGY